MDLRTRSEMLAALPRLRRFARGLVGNQHEADDLVQTACERAIRHFDGWEPGARLDSWMFRVLQTAWIDRRRAQRVRNDYVETIAAVTNPVVGGEAQALASLTLGMVDAAMQLLPESQRAVLLLVCVEQLSYAEAAEVLGVPVGTVMSRLARGRLALRRLIDGVEPSEGIEVLRPLEARG
jgi:RNA polymerase sigma-70 factor (ECF subfamily)